MALSCRAALSALTVGGRRSERTRAVFGRSTLPAFAGAGRPSAPVTESIGRQVRFSARSARSAVIGCIPCTKETGAQISSPSTSAARFACSLRSTGICAWKAACLTTPVRASSMPIEELACDARAFRHHAARVAGVHALGKHFDSEHAVDEAAQRSRAPELVVVAAAESRPITRSGAPMRGASASR